MAKRVIGLKIKILGALSPPAYYKYAFLPPAFPKSLP